MHNACLIRPVVHADLPILLTWRNHPDVRQFMLSQHEISLKEHLQWFASVSIDPSRKLMIIEDTTQPIGFVQFSNVADGGIADWGFYTRPGAKKGTGRELGLIALNYAFQSLKVHKVCGRAIESNKSSIILHKRLGFSNEGILRDQQRIGCTYHSLFCFGLLAWEWNAEKLF